MIFLNWKLKTTVKGHPFMTSKKNHVFDPPPPCPHGPPCGRPHPVHKCWNIKNYMYSIVVVLLLLLSTPLSHLGLITAPHSMSVSLLCVWAASSVLSALPRAS